MKLQESHFINSVVLMLILLIFLPGVQGIRQEAAPYSGRIESIDQDSTSIVVNGARILISGNATIVDEKGNILKADVLKSKPSVVIEGARCPEGFWANKIIVTTPKKKP